MESNGSFVFLAAVSALALGCAQPAEAPAPEALEAEHRAGQRTYGWALPLSVGAEISGAYGLAVGPAGDLHVTSLASGTVSRVSPYGLGPAVPTAGFAGPDDVAFSPAGVMYVTDFLGGQVWRVVDGVPQHLAEVGPGPNGIAFSPDGRLFVSTFLLSDALYELDPEPTGDGAPADPRLVGEGYFGLNAMAFGPDGALYGPRNFLGDVARIDVESGEATSVAGGFASPVAVDFGPDGRLFVVDSSDGAVWAVDLDTGARQRHLQTSPGADNLAFDSHGTLFVTNSTDGTIDARTRAGRRWRVRSGGVSSAGGLAVAGDRLYVADTLSMRALDTVWGRQMAQFYAPATNPGLSTPLTVATFGDHVLTSSWFTNVVQVFDPATQQLVAHYDDFAGPLNAIEFDGRIVVAELLTGCVVALDPATGDRQALRCGFGLASGLAADGGDLYAADWATGDVWQLIADGAVVSPDAPVASGLVLPEGLVSVAGDLIVLESGLGRVVRLGAEGDIEVLLDGLAPHHIPAAEVPPTFAFGGLAADACGSLYVANAQRPRVIKLLRRGFGAFLCRLNQL